MSLPSLLPPPLRSPRLLTSLTPSRAGANTARATFRAFSTSTTTSARIGLGSSTSKSPTAAATVDAKATPKPKPGPKPTPTSSLVQDLFHDHASATFLGASGANKSLPKCGGLPEIIVIGRANVGKSTLLNSVLGRKDLLNTSKKAGRTRSLNFYRLGRSPGKAVLVDAPGYGARGRPEWGEVFEYYLDHRKELRRVFILINASHGLKDADIQMLDHLSSKLLSPSPTSSRAQPFTIQAVLTKADMLPQGKIVEVVGRLRRELVEKGPYCLPPIVTSEKLKFGFEEVRRSVAEACGLVGVGAGRRK